MAKTVKMSLNGFLFTLSIVFILIATFFAVISSGFTKVGETLLDIYEEETTL